MRPTLLPAALALVLAACGAQKNLDAASDVRALLVAIRADDAAAFERYVNREALRADLRRQAEAEIADQAGAYAGLLDGLVDQAADQLIRPETFRTALQASSVPDRIPSTPEIAALLKDAGDGGVCLEDARTKECALTFRKTGEDWRLTAVKVTEFRAPA